MINSIVKTKTKRVLDERYGYFRKIFITFGWLEEEGKIIDDSYFETRSPYLGDVEDMEKLIIGKLIELAGAA